MKNKIYNMRKCEEREGIECEKQRKNELSILNRKIWKGLTEKTALESDLEEPENIWRESILGRDNYKGKVWCGCMKCMFQEQHRSLGYFRVKWGMDRTIPDHARSFRSILVKTLSLNEMGSHQKILRQRVTGSDILFTFY